MNRASRFAVRAALAAALLAVGAPAYAFRMIQATTGMHSGVPVACNDPGGFLHWPASCPATNIDFFLNTANQGAGKETALQNAMAAWSNVAGGFHRLNYAGMTTAAYALNVADGVNAINWATTGDCTNSCLAITVVRHALSSQVITEADILFNDAKTWDGSTAGARDTQGVATHELGHALGIEHSEVTAFPPPTMAPLYDGTNWRSLEADDRAALECSRNTFPRPAQRPSSLTVTSLQCFGWNDAEWTAGQCATTYRLQRSTSITFSNPVLVYSGPDLFRLVNVSGTNYLRVQGCNTAGQCSTFRSGNTHARYVATCH